MATKSSQNTSLLITRPEKSGRALLAKCDQLGIKAISQPLFDFQSTAIDVQPLMSADIVIFVSVPAVEFAEPYLASLAQQNVTVFAIGDATQKALNKFAIQAIAPEHQVSEGLLTLEGLQSVEGKRVCIVRGNGGRELIAEQLAERGARVDYLEVYQRVWRSLNEENVIHWQSQGVNSILITSNAIFERLETLVTQTNNTWFAQCVWIAASERIAEAIKARGYAHVLNAGGANDQAILECIAQHGSNNDREESIPKSD